MLKVYFNSNSHFHAIYTKNCIYKKHYSFTYFALAEKFSKTRSKNEEKHANSGKQDRTFKINYNQ